MLSSITPLGERSRNNRWWVTTAWYTAGSVLGGATMGLVAGMLGALVMGVTGGLSPTAISVFVAASLALALLFDTGALGEGVPSVHRQVNEDWLTTYRSWVYGGGFGWQLGTGVVTIVPTAATYVTWLMAVLVGSIGQGVAIGVVFGLARALPLLTIRSAADPASLRTFHRTMSRAAPIAHRIVAIGLVTALAGSIVAMLSAGA